MIVSKLIKNLKQRVASKLSKDNRQNLKNSTICVAGHIVTILSLLITTPLLLSKLGKEGMGIIILAKSILGITGVLSFGMGKATLRYVSKYLASKNYSRVEDTIRTTNTFYAILGVIVSGAFLLFSDLIVTSLFDLKGQTLEEATFAFKVGALGLFGALLSESLGSALKAFERFDLAVPIDVIARLILLVGQVLLLNWNYGISELMMLFVVVKLLTPFALMFALVRFASKGIKIRIFPQLKKEVLRETLSFGFFAWGATLIRNFRSQGVPWIIGAFVGLEAVSLFSIASNILGQVSQLLGKATSYLLPYLSKINELGKKEDLEEHYYHITELLLMASSAVVTSIFVCGLPVLSMWLGADDAKQVFPLVQILAVRFAVMPLGAVNYAFIAATGEAKMLLIIQTVASSVVILSTLVGVQAAGLTGAAWAQLSVLLTLTGNRLYIEKVLFGRAKLTNQILLICSVSFPLILGHYFILQEWATGFLLVVNLIVWALAGGFINILILKSRVVFKLLQKKFSVKENYDSI